MSDPTPALTRCSVPMRFQGTMEVRESLVMRGKPTLAARESWVKREEPVQAEPAPMEVLGQGMMVLGCSRPQASRIP